nr:MAG TPA: hypothetical protein [Crassvirales sp.]
MRGLSQTEIQLIKEFNKNKLQLIYIYLLILIF